MQDASVARAAYSYDPASNRILKNDSAQLTTYAYNAANELILLQPPAGAPVTSSYDSNGNLSLENAGGALGAYLWDYENRMTGISSSLGATVFAQNIQLSRDSRKILYVQEGEALCCSSALT